MIGAAARADWRQLEAKLRPFIARRLQAEADVDDVLQDVYLRLQRGIADLRDDERFGPWVYQVARSALIDHLRRAAKHALTGTDPAAWRSVAVADEQADVEQELARYVASFVALLPAAYREALTLTELQGLTQKEAAELLGISLSGMKSRVQRGREQLRAVFEQCCRLARDARGRVMACEPRPDGLIPNCRCDDGGHDSD